LSMIVPALMFDYQRQWMQATSPELRVKASGLVSERPRDRAISRGPR
jgi:hypothetical protein